MEEDVKKKDIVSPIINSLLKDTGGVSVEIVKNDAIPNEEAMMLANIQSVSSRERKTRTIFAMSFFVVIFALGIFIIPNLFSNNLKAPVVDIVPQNLNLIKTDIAYNLLIPAEVDFAEFRVKDFKSEVAFSELVLTKNNEVVLYKDLAPFVNERFLKSFLPVSAGEYVYGIYTGEDKISYPFFVLNISPNKRVEAETIFKDSERTIYRDLGIILQLPDDVKNENLEFKEFASIRNPLRELTDSDGKEIMVYGFANDEIVVFATNRNVYNALKARILTGY
jgi:hypothetical protein